ncbi:MAG TPA: cytochrome B6 [Oscillatoriales bacterium UBA8482]|nr:MAG: cytochrome B6 [Oscillatoriales cyanobacterium CG2_30_40_61]HBW57778.1 cytochrome B6 [Oscillatoriales bacterium UBA8482]
MKRREFVGLVGVGSMMPLAIAACSSGTKENPTVTSPRSDGFVAVGTVSDLTAKGQLLAEKTPLGKVLVIQDPTNTNQVKAVNPICSHAGCAVTWEKDQNVFVCPCHDSKFAGDGKVLQGPANQPLPIYLAKVEKDSILVKIN